MSSEWPSDQTYRRNESRHEGSDSRRSLIESNNMSTTSNQSSTSRRVAVIQSCYLPWKGYFDIIHDVDVFIFYDDVKYTKNDWRNRNIVKMGGSPVWLTIPIGKEAVKQRICDVQIPSSHWQLKHWRTLNQCYGKYFYFTQYAPYFEEFYCRHTWTNLSELNQVLIRQLCVWLGIQTVFEDSRKFQLAGAKEDRLLNLLEQVGATSYLSGPAARAYIDPAAFARKNIEIHFKDYQYQEYPQGKGSFLHHVSVVDLLFRFGSDCKRYIWGNNKIAVDISRSGDRITDAAT